MAKFQRFGGIRQLHTIISQQTIKPASPTPSHLKTYNLSLLDGIVPNMSNDFVFFYPKYMNNVNTNVLKQSLSQSLARYYPLAGRFPSPSASYVDCNDEGIDFVEVSTDSQLSDFIVKKYHDETVHHLFPNGLGLKDDGLTVASFVNHWATVARGESPIDPTFISSPASNSTEVADEYAPEYTMGASTNKSYDSSLLYQPFNVRGIIAGNYPETTAGNVITCAITKMKNSGQMQLSDMVNELRKRKMEVRGLKDMKEAAQYWTNTLSTLDQGHVYTITSVCFFVLMDTPSGDGIEAIAHLREDEMAIFENDKEILAYVQEDV
ncbi:acylsugar acyltransferase 3-like protein [Tanacetum coccineum]